MMQKQESPGLMEPMMPEDGNRPLEDLAVDLVAKANRLASFIRPPVYEAIGDLVRSMNCYYSNLIEGHNTHPRDIERALAEDFSEEKGKRALQLEAKAHIELQKKIDEDDIQYDVMDPEFIIWLHKEFFSKLPDEPRWIKNPDTGEQVEIIPGEFRQGGVKIGRHIPPSAKALPRFMKRFQEAYDISRLSKVRRLIAAGASHHRLLWIHPFYDGNGRVARLFSHTFLKQLGIGCSLWSISRGLARNHVEYKKLLMFADEPRYGDLDGRGTLTLKGLNAFCEFFLTCCIDQIEFMETLLEPKELLQRMEKWTETQVAANKLPKRAFLLLREAFVSGEFDRGKAPIITNYKERQARTTLKSLVDKGLLVSDGPNLPVRLAFPVEILEDWFPKLFIG